MPQDDKPKYFSETEKNRRLEALRSDMVNGMSDKEVSDLTGIPARSVQRWRLANGLRKPKGFEAKQLADVFAISTLGEALGDVRQRARRSVVNGVWEPPAFVVRQHLDYDLFLRLLYVGKRVLGMSEDELGKALGVTPKSIEQGLVLYERHLQVTEKKCLTCGHKVDPNIQSLFCTALCESLYGRQSE